MSTRFPYVFLHANGYPPGVYRQFFDAMSTRGEQLAAPLLETAPETPARLRWNKMLGIALNAIDTVESNESLTLIGHSMGGYLSLRAAAARPDRVKRVILIESPVPTGWRAAVLNFAKLTGLSYRVGPAPIAHKRREHWSSMAEAQAFFAKKHFTSRFATGVLDDFVQHALTINEKQDQLTLTVRRHIERDIYAHVDHHRALRALRSLKAKKIPVHFIAGKHSDELRLAGLADNRALFSPNFHLFEHCGHLVPLENPTDCAQWIISL